MNNYIVKNGETITDVVVNSTGSLSNWNIILQANNFDTWTPILIQDQSIIIPDNIQLQPNVLNQMYSYPYYNCFKNQILEQFDDLISIFETGHAKHFEDGFAFDFEDENPYNFES